MKNGGKTKVFAFIILVSVCVCVCVCVYIYIYIYVYMCMYGWDGMRVERMKFSFNPFELLSLH